jgi:uncharacterized protein YbjT (DUF2867 family)
MLEALSGKVSERRFAAVTGAFSYTGRYIAERLLARGERVVTLTNHLNRRDPFAGRVEIQPYAFERPEELVKTLRGVSTLFNTYWVRFPHGSMTYERAVENSKILIRCARVEQALRESGLSYAIIRPTVVFGDGGILIHNIAWLLRKFPVFALPGRGDCRLQPVFVEDLADLAVEAAARSENETLDAAGPEIFTFAELVELLARTVGSRARIVRTPPMVSLALAKIAGLMVRDVILTKEEVESLLESLVVSHQPVRGKAKLTDWLKRNSASLGRNYHNELSMHFRREHGRFTNAKPREVAAR